MKKIKLSIIFLLLLICFFEIRDVQLIQARTWDHETQDAYGIVHGTPEWRVYQNRILGPFLVQGLSLITKRPFESAYKTAFSILMIIPIMLCYSLVRRITQQSRMGLIASAVFAMAVVAMQDRSWFYVWDVIDLTTMLLFAYAVFYARSNLLLLIPLFFAELLNRESAGFIAFWIILSAINIQPVKDAKTKFNVLPALIGVALLAGGAWWTHFIRTALFKHSINPNIGLDTTNMHNGEVFTLCANLINFVKPHDGTGFAIGLICCGVIVYLLRRLLGGNGGAKFYPAAILLVAMMAAVWTFGAVIETRVWLEFIPFGIMMALVISDQEKTTITF